MGGYPHLIRLPKGYDTVMSRTFADGEELSIGQWQNWRWHELSSAIPNLFCR